MSRIILSVLFSFAWLSPLLAGDIILEYSPRNTGASIPELRYTNVSDETFREGWGPYFDAITETIQKTGIKQPRLFFQRAGGILKNTNVQFDEYKECYENPATQKLGDPVLFAREIALLKRRTKAKEIIVYVGIPIYDSDYQAAKAKGEKQIRDHIKDSLAALRAANVSIALDAGGGGNAGQDEYDLVAMLLSEGRTVYVEPNPARKHTYDLTKVGGFETPWNWNYTRANPTARYQANELASHAAWLDHTILPWWSLSAQQIVGVVNEWRAKEEGDIILPGAAAKKVIDAGLWPEEWK